MDVGSFSLCAALLLSLYSFGASVAAHRRRSVRLFQSAENAAFLVTVLLGLSLCALGAAFLRHDYRLSYVWKHSNNDMLPAYLVSAIWGGMEGSLLLWAAMGSLFGSLALYRSRALPFRVRAALAAALQSSTAFFLAVVVFAANPFVLVPAGILPADGNGLNPLLQNPSMIIHPPSLYLGFTGLVVPFAFAVAALVCPGFEPYWTQYARRWLLVSWGFLTAGIVLGANWAYIVLGWGGFWGWDPVENASFLPWLTATALVHTILVEERRGLLRLMNVLLAVLSYALAVFGTFLTRSGIVQSVHAFAESNVGWIFLLYLAVLFVTTVVLTARRARMFRSDGSFDFYLSREMFLLLGSLVLLSICFATFWGMLFPVFSEAVLGEKSVVGPPFYNAVNGPLFLALLFFMGVGPLLAWRRTTGRAAARAFGDSLAAGVIGFATTLLLAPGQVRAALAIGLAVFSASAVLTELFRTASVRAELSGDSWGRSFLRMVKRTPRRIGSHLSHLGVITMAVAITGSTVFKIERDVVLRPGDLHRIGSYELRLERLRTAEGRGYAALFADVTVRKFPGGEVLSTMTPERRFYPRNEEVTSEVAIRMTPREDLYVALAGLGETPGSGGKEKANDLQHQEAVFKVFLNPLQIWLWVGALLLLAGTACVLRTGPRESREAVEVLMPQNVEA